MNVNKCDNNVNESSFSLSLSHFLILGMYIVYIACCYVVVKIYSDLYFDYRPVNVALGGTMQGQI